MRDNKQVDRMVTATRNSDRRRWRGFGGKNYNVGAFIALIIICAVWYMAAHIVTSLSSSLIWKT